MKFAAIIKVRKQQMDVLETTLARVRGEKNILQKKVIALLEAINETQIPQAGDIAILSLCNVELGFLRREKETLQRQLLGKKEQIKKLLNDYKKARMEFEKIKYLEEQEYMQYLAKLKKKEQNDMDEIATMLFSNKGA